MLIVITEQYMNKVRILALYEYHTEHSLWIFARSKNVTERNDSLKIQNSRLNKLRESSLKFEGGSIWNNSVNGGKIKKNKNNG